MTIIEEVFGEGAKWKDLTPDQKRVMTRYYQKRKLDSLSDEDRRAYYRKNVKRYKENNKEKYLEYQREYRKKRLQEDPEFLERTREHTVNYYKRKAEEENQ